ncbi:MAG: DUF4124 domain-containing protein [Steroidobacteraceae bacterium]|nr:DUF4124 domain-containing protein [Steroidobacteraceae bacterium]
MSRIHKVLLAFLMAGLTAVAAADTVYKWVDGKGQIHYTDLPPSQADAKILGIVRQAGVIPDDGYDDDNGDEGDDSGSAATTPSGMPTTPEPPVSRAAMEASQNDALKAKVEQCKSAQDRYQRYIESRRLFREVNGQRVYLTEQELAEARARARQDMDDYCN